MNGWGPGEDAFEDAFANVFYGFAPFALEERDQAVAAEGFVAEVLRFDDAIGVEEEDVAGFELLLVLFDALEFTDSAHPWPVVGDGFDAAGGGTVDEGFFVAAGKG